MTKFEIGKYDEADDYLQKNLDIIIELHQEYPNDQMVMNNLSAAYEKKGDLCTSLGNLKKAQEFYLHKLKLNEFLASNAGEIEKSVYDLGIAYEKIGSSSLYLQEFEKSLGYFEKWQLVCEKLISINPLSFNNKKNLARAILFKGYALFKLKNEKSIIYLLHGEQLLKNLTIQFPDNVDIKESLLNAAMFLGAYYDWKNLLEKSINCYLNAYQLSKMLFEQSPDKFRNRKRYLESLNSYIERIILNNETTKIKIEIDEFRTIANESLQLFENNLEFLKYNLNSFLYHATFNSFQEVTPIVDENFLKAINFCEAVITKNTIQCIEIIRIPLTIAELNHRIKNYKLAEMIFESSCEILEKYRHLDNKVDQFLQNIKKFLDYYKHLNT